MQSTGLICVSVSLSSGQIEQHTFLLLFVQVKPTLVNVSPGCDDVTTPSGKRNGGVHDHLRLINVFGLDGGAKLKSSEDFKSSTLS